MPQEQKASKANVPAWHLGYASSECPIDEERLSVIASTYAQAYTRHFVRTHRLAIESDSRDLTTFIETWAQTPSDFLVSWNYVFGDIRRAATERVTHDKVIHTAATLGLWLMMNGHRGHFTLCCTKPIRPVLNHHIFPEFDQISALATGSRIEIATALRDRKQSVVFILGEDGWQSDQSTQLVTCNFRGGVSFSYAALLSIFPIGHDDGETYERTIINLEKEDVDRFNEELLESLQLIEDAAPSFVPWIGRVLRHVVPVAPPPGGGITSGSSEHWPGVIELSFGCGRFAIAEMLIHECAHQYFFLLARTEPVDDGADHTLYFSPLKNTGRPIQMILTGYHAFANILLFYRACQAAKINDNGYCSKNEAALIPQLRQLELALRETKSLTQVGKSFWLPLSERINIQ